MVTFNQLYHARLGSLKNAVDDWTETVKKLQTLEESASNGMLKKAEKADWAGENAGITLPFVKKTAKEFGDAATEAESIRNILRDALAEFKTAKQNLTKVVEDAPGKGIRIDADGTVSHQVHPDRRSKDYDGPEPTEADFDKVRADIKAALDRANDADEVASRALRTLVGKDKNNFSGTDYDSLKQAGRAQDAQDAKAAAKIVAKGDDASAAEIDRLNKYFKDNKGDQYFAERFALEVGAKGSLDYWVDMGDASDGSHLASDNREEIKELQKNWSMTLAAATHSHSPAMEQWKSDVIKSGDDVIRSRGSSAYGFQVMSNLMRYGSYDTKFLNAYGDAVVVAENKMTHDGRIKPGQAWSSGLAPSPRLNWDGKDLGRDPMAGFMEALGHNAKASTSFFNSSIDLTPDNPSDNKKVDAFKYFTEERDWPGDTYEDGFGNKYGYDSLGHALESATTGHAYDAAPDGLRDARTEENAKVMQKVVSFYGSDPKHMHEQGIADSLSKIGTAYIDEFNRSLEQESATAEHEVENSPFGANKDGRSRFGEEYDTALLFTRGDTVDFMSIVAQSEEGHGQLSAAQSLYTASVLDAAGPEPTTGKIDPVDLTDAKTALRIGSEAHGILDYSRMGQIDKDFEKDSEEYNKKVAQTTEWIKFGAGVAIGGGVAAITGGFAPAAVLAPLAVEYVGGAVETYLGTGIDDLSEKYAKKGTDLLKEKSDDLRDEALLMGKDNALIPAESYAYAPGWSDSNRNYVLEELTASVKNSRIHATEDPLPDPYEAED
ncbi:hypothetical protein [Streptomyces sp. CC219B]|uniref:hypothetical protein n=1 Tax=Streptomyces sp. CC219B TaxID=3044574 RepID=UPI0024A9AB3A|nr:hypothetical protein [Streptomyces sp. CC219B]